MVAYPLPDNRMKLGMAPVTRDTHELRGLSAKEKWLWEAASSNALAHPSSGPIGLGIPVALERWAGDVAGREQNTEPLCVLWTRGTEDRACLCLQGLEFYSQTLS